MKAVLGSLEVEADDAAIDLLLSKLEGKELAEVITAGKEALQVRRRRRRRRRRRSGGGDAKRRKRRRRRRKRKSSSAEACSATRMRTLNSSRDDSEGRLMHGHFSLQYV